MRRLVKRLTMLHEIRSTSRSCLIPAWHIILERSRSIRSRLNFRMMSLLTLFFYLLLKVWYLSGTSSSSSYLRRWTCTNSAFEILESHNDYCNVIQWLSIKRIFKNSFYSKTCVLMHSKFFIFWTAGLRAFRFLLRRILLVSSQATDLYTFSYLFITELVKYTITS